MQKWQRSFALAPLQPRSPPSAGVTADKDSVAPAAYRVLGSPVRGWDTARRRPAVLNPNRCRVGRDADRADLVGRGRVGVCVVVVDWVGGGDCER
jgi:hypothetical protein